MIVTPLKKDVWCIYYRLNLVMKMVNLFKILIN